MKICFVAPADNYHTRKWCNWFLRQGHEIHVVSLIDAKIEGITVYWLNSGVNVSESDRKKLKYLLQARKLKKIVERIHPDIISVHYATSYGAIAALSGVKNYVLSVWGSDIYDFPQKSLLHRLMLMFSLSRAECLFSTSRAMADEARKYTKKGFVITPFGVDMDLFSPDKRHRNYDGYFVIGTVKAISPKYGIDYLLKAASLIRKECPEIPLKLRISGKGSCENEYKKLAVSLGIADITTWCGFISQERAAEEWANMDLAIVASTLDSESFGVSAIEAESCEIPLVISDIPGLMEATKPGVTSIVVTRKNERALADAIVDLYYNSQKRILMGKEGRKYVAENYELDDCFKRIEKFFYEKSKWAY